MKKPWIWVAGSLLLGLCGCMDVKTVSAVAGKWPTIKQPPELVLTADQMARINKWAAEDPDLIKSIKRQSDAYRAGIEEHNRQAREHNRKVVEEMGKALGWSVEDIQEALKKEQ